MVFGINPVLEALRAGRVVTLRVGARQDARVAAMLRLAAERGARVERVDAATLDRLARGAVHQGVIADVSSPRELTVTDLVREAADVPLLVVLDGIEDPHNLGAILRSAEAAGVDGVVRQARRAAAIDGAAAKASAGAIAHVKIATVVNIARAVEQLSEAGVWSIGLAGNARTRYDEVDLALPTALVLGAEGTGLRRLVRERCDVLAAIPMRGHVDSLNVSAAAAIVLFEALRQRRVRGEADSGHGAGEP
jgi:23S rRNA (guanosine2251-2'-O)-methyltransferase